MPFDLLDVVTRFVLPPILGGAGGLISVYANWGIEQQRQRLARRRELVTGWRMNLIPLLSKLSTSGPSPGSNVLHEILASPYYGSLRPHLRSDIVQRLEGKSRVAVAGENFPLEPILIEIGRIERHWRLV
jgi:hypothetical protein